MPFELKYRKINIDPNFQKDLTKIIENIEGNFGKQYANKSFIKTQRLLTSLSLFPGIGTQKKDFMHKYKNLFGATDGHNWILYSFTNEEIYFVAIKSTKQNIKPQK